MSQANIQAVPRLASTIEGYYELQPGRFGPIHTLEFVQVEAADRMTHCVRVILSEAPGTHGPWLTLEFREVSDFGFSQPDWSVAALGLVEIRESGDGFLVTEEEGNLRLRCQSFEARVDAALQV